MCFKVSLYWEGNLPVCTKGTGICLSLFITTGLPAVIKEAETDAEEICSPAGKYAGRGGELSYRMKNGFLGQLRKF